MTPPTTAPALAGTVARADAVLGWLSVRIGLPDGAPGWTACADVDPVFVAAWEAATDAALVARYGRTDPRTASALVLDRYAGAPGHVGGAFFRLARRVPRLDPESLAVHRHVTEQYLDGLALLDDRFWCLPGDPAADDPAATVVPDDAALAAVLRGQVRAHADRVLSWYRPGARLPRRSLLGAFVDALDVGVWLGGDHAGPARDAVLADASTVLPGRTPEFREGSTLHVLIDDRGRTHLTRERISCCYYYRLDDAGEACFTCPRTTRAERRRRAAQDEES